MKTNKKKGQVTVFILLGLVFVASISILVYIQQQGLVFRTGKLLPTEVIPAVDYVEMCVYDLGREALLLAGHQGGYVELPDYIKNNQFAHLGKTIKIPYWYYEGRDIYPSIEEIETQLGNYVDENIESCLNNLEQFRAEFNIWFGEEHSVDVIIGRKDVNFKLNYPIVMEDKLGQTKIELLEYNSKVSVAFKEVYELAKKILEKENSDMYFEQITLDLMGMNKEIPFTGLNFECLGGPMQWKVSDVSSEIKDALSKDIPRVRVKGTNHPPFLEDLSVYEELEDYDIEDVAKGNLPEYVPQDSYDYFHYFWELGYNSDLKAGFNYLPEYGMMLKVRPSSKGIMKSNVAKGAQFLSFLCFHMYHFSYDLNFPIEIMIRDDESLNGEGYVFRYAIPIMVDHNLPNREKITQTIFGYDASEHDYSLECDTKTGEYDIIIKGFDEFLYESELEEVNVSYDCLKYECKLGTTEFLDTFTGIKTGLPPGCSGGFIKAEREGYLEIKKQVSMEQMQEGILEFWMPMVREFSYSIVKHKYFADTKTMEEAEFFNGTATVRLVQESNNIDDMKIYSSDEENIIDMLIGVPQTYSLEIMMLDENEDVIGGYMGDWTVSYEDLKDKNELVFHTFEYWPKPVSDEQKMDFYMFLFEGEYQDLLNHEFILVDEQGGDT